MPSAIESPSSPSRRTPRAERRLAGRFLLQAAALLGVVVAIALALVALRPGDEPRPPTAASSTDPAPTNAPDAPTLAAAPERGLDRSPEPLADAAPSPTAERSEADTARLDSMNGAALAASSANAPDKSPSRAPRPDAGEAVAGPQADGTRSGTRRSTQPPGIAHPGRFRGDRVHGLERVRERRGPSERSRPGLVRGRRRHRAAARFDAGDVSPSHSHEVGDHREARSACTSSDSRPCARADSFHRRTKPDAPGRRQSTGWRLPVRSARSPSGTGPRQCCPGLEAEKIGSSTRAAPSIESSGGAKRWASSFGPPPRTGPRP